MIVVVVAAASKMGVVGVAWLAALDASEYNYYLADVVGTMMAVVTGVVVVQPAAWVANWSPERPWAEKVVVVALFWLMNRLPLDLSSSKSNERVRTELRAGTNNLAFDTGFRIDNEFGCIFLLNARLRRAGDDAFGMI